MQAGGAINDFQSRTYARIQLSKAAEYYPGTAERTLLVTGRLKQIIAALGLIFAKLNREGVAPLSPRTRSAMDASGQEAPDPSFPTRFLVKVLVPQAMCGIVIGKGGATVRAVSADTGTFIRVTSPEGPAVSLNHRVVTVNGAPEGVCAGAARQPRICAHALRARFSAREEKKLTHTHAFRVNTPHTHNPVSRV